ncbi:MAG: Ig-like domain-containing protein, partial [Nitrosopumilaceae archaeon]
DVSGFELGDITVTNGVASNLAGGPSVYTFDVTPSSDGLVSVDIDADVAQDSSGNGNFAAATLSITYDGTGPSVVLSTTASDPTNISPIPVTATFSEDVSGFELGDITVTNGVASNLAGGPSVYTFDVTPSSNGLVSVDVDADVAQDSSGNGNTAAATLSRVANVFSLSATVLDKTIILLDWNDAPTVICNDLIGYDIYRMGPDDEGFVYLASVGADTTEYSDTELDGNTEYTYIVVAVYGDEECPLEETNEVSATTEPFLNRRGGLSFDVTAPMTNGISFSSTQDGTDTEEFGGRLASYSNDIPTQVMNTGVEQRLQVDIYDNNGIAAVKRVVINMFFDYLAIQKADTYFMYEEDGQKLTVSDPNGFFGDVKVHRTYTETEMILVFVFTPQKPMPITDLVINSEDEYRNNQNTIVFGAFEIQGEPITSVESSVAAAEIPYYKNPDWNQFVIDADGDMATYDSFGNLEKNQTPVMDEFVQYGSYIGKSERHDDGFYIKVSAEKTRAQKLVDSRDSHKIFQEPQKVFKVDKVFKYPSTVGKADRENVKAMNELKQKEHSKALNVAKKLS